MVPRIPFRHPVVDSQTRTDGDGQGEYRAGRHLRRQGDPADGISATLPNAFTMTQGGQAILKTNLIVPSVIGNHGTATFYIQYTNTGDVAMPARSWS